MSCWDDHNDDDDADDDHDDDGHHHLEEEVAIPLHLKTAVIVSLHLKEVAISLQLKEEMPPLHSPPHLKEEVTTQLRVHCGDGCLYPFI